MKYLITGAAGFIGSHLVELLIKNNHKVVCVDDLSTGHLSNLSSVIKKIDFYEEKIELFDFNKLSNIDAIVHLAAQPSVPISITDFFDSSSSNLLATIKIIDYCRLNHTPLIYASSSAVYGNLKFGSDEVADVDLLSPYATDKYTMELYSKTAHNIYKLSSIGLRFFNVYGPRQDPGSPYSGVISIFSDRLSKGKGITINGGHQTRDFIYVKDVVDIIYRAILLTLKNSICEVSNVLTGRSVTINDVAEQIMDIIDIRVNINYKSLGVGDPEQSNGSTKKMTKLFTTDVDKFTNLDRGLIDTVQYILNDN
jgi:UDP-glucose 4-epimerase